MVNHQVDHLETESCVTKATEQTSCKLKLIVYINMHDTDVLFDQF